MAKHIFLKSSNLKSAQYFSNIETLEVEFKNNNIYRYFDVPENIYKGLINSESVGRYFASEIRDKYKYEKVLK